MYLFIKVFHISIKFFHVSVLHRSTLRSCRFDFRAPIRTHWSFWWVVETNVKYFGRFVWNTIHFFVCLINPSPKPKLSFSLGALPSDIGICHWQKRKKVNKITQCSPFLKQRYRYYQLLYLNTFSLFIIVLIQNPSVSGRTQKQLVDFIRENGSKRTPYQRCVFPHYMQSRVGQNLMNLKIFLPTISDISLTKKCFLCITTILFWNNYFRRNSKIRMSARSLASEVPIQVSCPTGLISVKTGSITYSTN